MKFSENIKSLRKQKGYSQEQLAEKLNVSRQAVSKWESDNGMPEIDTLLIISELFHCSIDSLLKESIQNKEIDEKKQYDTHRNKMNLHYTFGVGIILSGVCMLLFLNLFFPEHTKQEYISEAAFLLFVMLGVILLVYTGIQDASFSKAHNIQKDLYTQEEKDEYQTLFAKMIALGVGILLFSIVIEIVSENLFFEAVADFLFFACITPGICILVYYSLQKAKYSIKENQEEAKETKKTKNGKIEKWCSCIMIVCAIIYFLWSFLWQAWKISWIVFPIGGMLCGIVAILCEE